MPLADFYATCARQVHPDTIAAIVAVESGGRPWTINTPHGAVYAHSREQATLVLTRALRTESSVDIGLMQINSQWLPKLRIAPDQLLDPCVNVRVGAAILAANFAAASRRGRTHLEALVAALSAYHSGSETAAVSYATQVLMQR
ncbi:MAG TPA: transglycosylase SLT domain-containing protein [Rudaea sp.]|jgi:type IV secretion system protein VirB1|nr:transglycosylase SLT domain-containing protein [Rudaea sp.]